MPNHNKKEVSFYTQAALLDRYIHSSNPASDGGALEVILDILRQRKDLRRYFFTNGPGPIWATIFWENGFFNEIPEVDEKSGMHVIPYWDVQEFLISVAAQASDIVMKQINSIDGPAWLISRSIKALSLLDPEKSEPALPQIIKWLSDPEIAAVIGKQALELIKPFAQKNKIEKAFTLFSLITTPLPPKEGKSAKLSWERSARSIFEQHLEEKMLFDGLKLLGEIDPPKYISVLEGNLCKALQLEAAAKQTPEIEFSAYWRVAIEKTSQDLHDEYKDRLLCSLRDALDLWIEKDPAAVYPLIERYLSDKHIILRRLGLYIIFQYPMRFNKFVLNELSRYENLDDNNIHHELFMLLRSGYSHLPDEKKELLVAQICKGPSDERVEELEQYIQQEYKGDLIEFRANYKKTWKRDRLWMLKDFLPQKYQNVLKELITQVGKPPHPPEFTSWSSGVYTVRDVSPLAEVEIARMSPSDLYGFLRDWQPNIDKQFGPDRESYRGLASVISNIISANLQKYSDHIISIISLKPEYACGLFEQFKIMAKSNSINLSSAIVICDQLLKNDVILKDMNRSGGISWIYVRKIIVELFQEIINSSATIIEGDQQNMRDILLMLVDDPDPDPESDRPPEGYFGHGDPANIAINHVRPEAISALINYASRRAFKENNQLEPGPNYMEKIVEETLTRKLDRKIDDSWAVHSVYGLNFVSLYALNQDWAVSHIDKIFPLGDNSEEVSYFFAAWSSYIKFASFYNPMLQVLHSSYLKAIDNLGKGYTELYSVQYLASHLIWEYFLFDCKLFDSEGTEEQKCMLNNFFEIALPEERGTAIWVLWRMINNNRHMIENYWKKVRSFWEWRLHEASMKEHPSEFGKEMEWFAYLANEAPESESITSLWPLLEGLLPYIGSSERPYVILNPLEEYLSREVDRDPSNSIKFYYLMSRRIKRPYGLIDEQKARKILETAAAKVGSRQDALSVIDLFAREGLDRFKDIYDHYQ